MPPKPAISPSVPPTKKKKKTKKTNNEIFLLVEEEEKEEEGFIVVVFLCLRVCVVRVCVCVCARVCVVRAFVSRNGSNLILGIFFSFIALDLKPDLNNISFLQQTKKASTVCTSSSLVCTARLQRAEL
jgi:hypothetical protein